MSTPEQEAALSRINALCKLFKSLKMNPFEFISSANSLIQELAPKSHYIDIAAAALSEPGDVTDVSATVEGHKAKRFHGILLALKADIKRGKVFSTQSDVPAFRAVEKLLGRFHRIAKQIKTRRENRSSLCIKDEYDVQDLLHALLLVHFDDIRKEEWTPKYAGGSKRMDFVLKKDRIVIEVKITKKKRAEKEIGDELLVDIPHYKEREDCNTLFCFIYDPDQHIRNGAGLKSDLEKNSTDDFSVVVVINPD